MLKKRHLHIFLSLTSLFMLMLMVSSVQSDVPQLVLNLRTDKTSYHYRQMVSIYGNVTFDGSLVEEGLVAIQLENPANNTLALRTVPANETPSDNWTVEITSFLSTDAGGNPKTIFNRNSFAYFRADMRNNNIFSNRTVLFTITLCDSDSTPFQIHWLTTTINPGQTHEVLVALYIDDWVSTGNATAYASVCTDWPKNGGYPYAPGRRVNFGIVTTSVTPYQPPEVGNSSYRADIRLPPGAQLGTYSITVSAYYKGNKDAFNFRTFTRQYELLGDIVYNRKINIYDIVKATIAYNSQGGDPLWNPEADLNPNGKIDIFDIVIVTAKYGTEY